MMSTGANSHEPTHAASRMLSVEVSAPLAPQALETGDFGIVVPIVFISLCMVLHRPGGLCSDGGYHFGGFPVWKNPPLGSYCRSVSSAVQTAPTHGKAMTFCVWCSLPTHPLRVPS